MIQRCPECHWLARNDYCHACNCSRRRKAKVDCDNSDPITFILACACGQTFHGHKSEEGLLGTWEIVHCSPRCRPVSVEEAMEIRESKKILI